MDFTIEDFHREIPPEELLADLKHAHEVLTSQERTLSFRAYATVGKFAAGTIAARFGSWNNAVAAAGLQPLQEKNVERTSLFDNLRSVWIAKGRQPVYRDMAQPPSKYRGQLYSKRFGSWRNALHEFVAYVRSDDWVSDDLDAACGGRTIEQSPFKRRTSRNISDRMRFRILLRDGFACQTCGASPLNDRGVELHVDHILPWSKGGETEDINLQTKCKRCNLGKGNAFIR